MAQTFDAIVSGCGSVGVPSAYHLARRGLRVLGLDYRSAVGQGDNKAAIGGVRATHSDPAKILLCQDSLNEMSTWRETHGDDIDWKPGGYCFPVYGEDIEQTLKGMLPLQKSYGLEIDWVDADAIAELIPGVERAGLRGGTFSPNDGQVSPLKAAVAFERAAMELGAKFRLREKVIGYLRDGDRVIGVKTDKGEYHAGHVVITAGADARGHGKLLGIDLPVAPDSHEAGITAPVEQFLGPLIVDLRPGPEGKTANFYFGQNQEGPIIFCYTPRELFPGTNREPLSEFLPVLARRMITLIPRFRQLLIRRVWRGCYPMTPDGVPIIDRVAEAPGLTVAVGMCGQGFMLGPGVGMNVAALVVDGKPLLPPDVHRPVSFGRDYYSGKKEALK